MESMFVIDTFMEANFNAEFHCKWMMTARTRAELVSNVVLELSYDGNKCSSHGV